MIDYAKLAILGAIFFAGAGFGWYFPHHALVEYKASIENAVKAQEAKVESIQQQHELVKKGIQDEYDAKLNLLRNYYANGVRQPDPSKLSSLSTTPSIANATAAYNQLAGQCAETTLMLVELQKWLTEVYSVK
jgi:hypothetical protein